MSTHYNAFISYKHADLDNKVAAYVEKHLEHFHIPGKIRKKTGIKKIERIFRDTDELPITSDLSGTIEEALKNADYLIVICSTNTCKSMWVEREIKFFLQSHPKENILTVLADGEPADVVPEILKNKEVTRVNENGESVTVIEPVEPLSCDFRLPLRVAKNTELPRLAAALIGCQYNELMDRQRQYKMKRLTAVFAGILALSLGFGAYMFHSKQKINESYREALISQSKYLANESGKLLDDEQRIDALHLALAALPSEEMPDRPVTVEAVRAVTKATKAYTPVTGSNIAAAWTYELPNTVDDMCVNPENKLFAAIDNTGNIKVWDTETHKELYSYSDEEGSISNKKIKILEDGTVIIMGSHLLMSVDPRTGKENWKIEPSDYGFSTSCPITVTDNGNLLFPTTHAFRVFSAKDGSVVNVYDYQEGMEKTLNSIDDFALSPDNTKIAFTLSGMENQDIIRCLGIYDIPSKEVMFWSEEYADISSPRFSNDNTLFVACSSTDYKTDSRSIFNMRLLTPVHCTVFCLSSEDLTEKWSAEFERNNITIDSKLSYVKDNNTVLFYQGEVANIYDASSGELLNHYVIDSPIVAGAINPKTLSPSFVTHAGGFASVNVDTVIDKRNNSNSVSVMYYFTGDLGKAIVGNGVYASKRGSGSIIYYNTNVCDEEWHSFENSPIVDSTYNAYKDNNVIATLTQEDDGIYANISNPIEKSFYTKAKLGDSNYLIGDFELLGTYEDNLIVISREKTEDRIITDHILNKVNYKTGQISSETLDKNTNIFTFENGTLVYVKRDYPKTFVVTYDLSTNKKQNYLVSDDPELYADQIYYFEKQGFIYFSGRAGLTTDTKELKDYIIDIKERELYPIEYSDAWKQNKYTVMNEDGTLIASTDTFNISIKDIKGNDIASIPMSEVVVEGFAFYKEHSTGRNLLIVPFTDGNLCRYDAQTGKLLYKDSYRSSTAFLDQGFKLIPDPDHSCVYMEHNNMTTIFDQDSFTELGYVPNSLGYNAPTDTFIALSKDEENVNRLGYFNHYTLDDLIRKAKEILGDHEMPKEQKEAYGIN